MYSKSVSSFSESVTTPQTKESPQLSHNSSGAPSRQESRNSIVPDGVTTPTKHENINSKPSSSDTSRRESRNSIALENKMSPKESPSESVNSSKRSSYISSRNSIVLENTNLSLRQDSKSNISHEIAPEIQNHNETSPKCNFSFKPSADTLQVHMNNKTPKVDDTEELADLETEWQYQLPSPPTAFRDSSPTNLTDVTNYDTITLQEFKEESVVTNPELFEKLRIVKESRCETETISDFNSVMSDDDKPMLSKLTLENLEKRKSLVYNRELSTSLKIAQESISSSSNNRRSIDETSSKRSSILSELEEVIHNGGSKSLARHNSCVTEKTIKPAVDSNLPNFKISTYDNPKRKINIFEDDSVRSNDNSLKTISYIDLSANKDFESKSSNFNCTERPFFTTKNSYIGRSMENISFKKQNGEMQSDDDDGFKKPQEFAKYKTSARSNFFVKHQPEMHNNVTRSESFSINYNMPVWKPHNPVQRSKSQVALNKYKEEQDSKVENDEHLSKSNSLFDVSGLQSLEVRYFQYLSRIISVFVKLPNLYASFEKLCI